jgi:hypothetical protein
MPSRAFLITSLKAKSIADGTGRIDTMLPFSKFIAFALLV